MREIKFRAWFKDTQEMKSIAMNNLYMGNKSSWMHLSPQPMSDYRLVEIMQYTGLKDNNGREIYEGDIVKRVYNSGSSFVGEVIFEEATYFMRNDEQYAFLANQYDSETLEVIGNIHENPHLLEGEPIETN